MTIFWDTNEQEWCEDCSEDVQFFHSIVLLEDEHKIPKASSAQATKRKEAVANTVLVNIHSIQKRDDPVIREMRKIF